MIILIRSDGSHESDDPNGVFSLHRGIQLFGRGMMLDCTDKRVSRNHCHLEAGENAVILKALHQNPCFYKRKDQEQVHILQKDSMELLKIGDSFGLLPDMYWFKVEFENEIQNEDLSAFIEADVIPIGTEYIPNESDNFPKCSKYMTNGDDIAEPSKHEDELPEERALESPSLLDKENSNPGIKDELVSLNDTQTNEGPIIQPHGIKREREDESESPNAKNMKLNPSDTQGGDNVASTSSEERPLIKVEKVEDNLMPQPNTSALQMPPSPQKPTNQARPPILRERCWYGTACYRKNLQHKSDFSHPSDRDWGDGPTAPCPYGVLCQKCDKRHWRDHSHPPGTHPPQRYPTGKKKRAPKKTDDADDTDTNAIVTGKRKRKQVNKKASGSGSESENEYDMEDPFMTDGSEDDWTPGAD